MKTQEDYKTALYQEHLALNAKMVSFGGWLLPVQYGSIMNEYFLTRKEAAIFDVCHMGEFIIEGDAKEVGLEFLLAQSLEDMPLKTCRYTTMLNSEGGIIDDLLIFRIAEKKWMMVVNAATQDKDEQHILQHLKDPSCFKNVSQQTGKLDVQGPKAREALQALIPGIDVLQYYMFDHFKVLNENVIVSRTGYTGELGYEIYFPLEKITVLWKKLLNYGIKPAGLGARDILRIEMGYCLYGHELTEKTNPLEAGLGRFVDWQKDFLGKQPLLALKEKKDQRKLIGILSQNRRAPREGQKIFSGQEKELGIVTSGTFSPALEKGIGLGYIDGKERDGLEKVFFGQAGNMFEAKIVRRPFYKEGSLKQ